MNLDFWFLQYNFVNIRYQLKNGVTANGNAKARFTRNGNRSLSIVVSCAYLCDIFRRHRTSCFITLRLRRGVLFRGYERVNKKPKRKFTETSAGTAPARPVPPRERLLSSQRRSRRTSRVKRTYFTCFNVHGQNSTGLK